MHGEIRVPALFYAHRLEIHYTGLLQCRYETTTGGSWANMKENITCTDNDVLSVCKCVDDLIADRLAESILQGTSYDMLEAHYGVIPVSRNCFYRRRRQIQEILSRRQVSIVEEKNGQMKMVWPL
jgi:hypothetical protein